MHVLLGQGKILFFNLNTADSLRFIFMQSIVYGNRCS